MHAIKRFQPLLLACLFMIGSIAGAYWLWMTVDQYGVELAEQAQIIADQQAFQSQFVRLEETIEKTAEQRTALGALILQDDGDTIGLLSEFDQIASEQGVELTTQNLSVAELPGSFNELVLSYSLGGSEAAVKRMISIFETMPYHSEVTSVSLARAVSPVGVVSANASVVLRVTINAYD